MIFPRFTEKEGINIKLSIGVFSIYFREQKTLAPPFFNPTDINMTSKLSLRRSEGYTVKAVIFAGTKYR